MELLQAMPKDADVYYLYRGFCIEDVIEVWLAKTGKVMVNDGGTVVRTEDRPDGAPTAEEDDIWGPGD